MFVAKNSSGQLVNALEDELPRANYTCPACKGTVSLKSGKIMRTHFAHRSLEQCQFYSENESVEHLTLKSIFYQWGKKHHRITIERHIAEIQQIADLFIDENLALEIQCSPLSQTRLRERTKAYRENGYHVIWILGEKLWLKESLRSLQKDFLYFSQSLGFYVWEADLTHQVLRLSYLIHEDMHGKLQRKIREFSFGEGELLTIFRFPFQQKQVETLWGNLDKDICTFVRKQLYFQVPKWMKLQEEAYLKGENLLEKEAKDFYPQVTLPRAEEFAQIAQDISWYRRNFLSYYQQLECKDEQILYSPAYYRLFFEKDKS
ncbi:Competence protein CoiA [Streptococcus sp. DD10]|uniref:competence protein CoiA n=1 Tax=Streptococcus sp. DD10 TaxID=1777878 RepID=UPI00079225BC|nr:competence protein CoiA family protein [Streptococcus sp. DD10]KXT73663.1 Competence protein CoiA [Streptococcus sp. DD10]